MITLFQWDVHLDAGNQRKYYTLLVAHKATCNINDHKILEVHAPWLELRKTFLHDKWRAWILVIFTANKKGIKNKWLFRIKERDELKQCEAKLVARDFIQKQGKCMLIFFSPVIQNKLVRHAAVLATKVTTEIYHAGVTIAFLNVVLPEVYVDTSWKF